MDLRSRQVRVMACATASGFGLENNNNNNNYGLLNLLYDNASFPACKRYDLQCSGCWPLTCKWRRTETLTYLRPRARGTGPPKSHLTNHRVNDLLESSGIENRTKKNIDHLGRLQAAHYF